MMTDGPDPLGKRALFWMPVDAGVQIRAGEEFELGSVSRNVGGQRADTLTQRRPKGEEVRHARPAGKHALYSQATPADEPERDRHGLGHNSSRHGTGSARPGQPLSGHCEVDQHALQPTSQAVSQ